MAAAAAHHSYNGAGRHIDDVVCGTAANTTAQALALPLLNAAPLTTQCRRGFHEVVLHFTQTRETSAVIRPISHPGHAPARTKINIAAQLTVYSAMDVSNRDTWRTQTDS